MRLPRVPHAYAVVVASLPLSWPTLIWRTPAMHAGSAADPDSWPPLTADEAVEWRYPPVQYWGRPEELRQQAGWQRQGQGPGGRGAGEGWAAGHEEAEGHIGEGNDDEEEYEEEEGQWAEFGGLEFGSLGAERGRGGGRTSSEVAWAQPRAAGAGPSKHIIPGLFD